MALIKWLMMISTEKRMTVSKSNGEDLAEKVGLASSQESQKIGCCVQLLKEYFPYSGTIRNQAPMSLAKEPPFFLNYISRVIHSKDLRHLSLW